MRKLILGAVIALSLLAAEGPSKGHVLVTEYGKTYHSTRCMALSRAFKTFETTEAAAKAHGLKACGICYRAKSEKSAKANNGDWAKGGK